MTLQGPSPAPEARWAAANERRARGPGRQRGWALGLVVGFALILGLAGALVGAYELAFAGRVYAGVEALGVDLGGLTRDEATAALAARVQPLLDARVTLVAADTRRAPTWRDLGLRLAADELADRALAVGRQGNPLRRLAVQWAALTRRWPLATDLALDETALAAYLQDVARAVDRPARDARLLVYPDATVEYTPSQVGRQLDVGAAATRVREAQRAGVREVTLPVAETPPQTPDALRREAYEFAQRVLAGPLVLRYADREWTVAPPELVDWLAFEGGPGQPLVARLAADAVRQRLAALAAEIDRPAVNARLD